MISYLLILLDYDSHPLPEIKLCEYDNSKLDPNYNELSDIFE